MRTTINRKDILKFKAASAGMKPSIIPALENIRFRNGQIIKTNIRQFVISKADFEGEFLVSEQVLMNFVQHTNADNISVEVTGNSIVLSDGKSKSTTKSPTDISLFPEVPVKDKGADVYVLTPDILDAIKLAAKFTATTTDTNPLRYHVMIGKSAVFASDSYIGFHQKLQADLPTIVLSREDAIKVGSLTECNYGSSEKYHFFESAEFTYISLQPDLKFYDYTNFFELNGVQTDLPRNEIINFCELCDGSTASKEKQIVLSGDASTLQMNMTDTGYEVSNTSAVEYTGNKITPVVFPPYQCVAVLKSLPPGERVTYTEHKHRGYFSYGNVTTLVQAIINNL